MTQTASFPQINLLDSSQIAHHLPASSSTAALNENGSRIGSLANASLSSPQIHSGDLPDNLSWRTPLDPSVTAAANEAIANLASSKGNAPKCHIHAAFMALTKQADLCRNKAHEYTQAINERNVKIEFLNQFKQHLKAGGEEIDWTENLEKQALVEKAKAHGVIFPEGGLKWSKLQVEALVSNVDSTINPLMSSSDQDRILQQWFLNKESESITHLTALLQKHHELATRIAEKYSR